MASSLNSFVAISKDLVLLLRDLSLLVLAILLIAFPRALNSVLVEAGFDEGSLVGFKWKAKLVESDDELKKAQDTIATLQAQNDELAKALAESNAKLNDSALKERLSKLYEDNKQLNAVSEQVRSSVAETRAANAPLIEKARSVTSAVTAPTAGFCYQEDRLRDGPERFSIHCHATKEGCEKARGPSPRWKQSACEYMDLSQTGWKPKSGGWMGAWYEFRGEPFGKPFPQLR